MWITHTPATGSSAVLPNKPAFKKNWRNYENNYLKGTKHCCAMWMVVFLQVFFIDIFNHREIQSKKSWTFYIVVHNFNYKLKFVLGYILRPQKGHFYQTLFDEITFNLIFFLINYCKKFQKSKESLIQYIKNNNKKIGTFWQRIGIK